MLPDLVLEAVSRGINVMAFYVTIMLEMNVDLEVPSNSGADSEGVETVETYQRTIDRSCRRLKHRWSMWFDGPSGPPGSDTEPEMACS